MKRFFLNFEQHEPFKSVAPLNMKLIGWRLNFFDCQPFEVMPYFDEQLPVKLEKGLIVKRGQLISFIKKGEGSVEFAGLFEEMP